MKEKVRFLGMDVHAETISVAVAEADGEVRSLGTIANRAESIRKLIRKLGSVEQLRACYEAGPTGYVLYWQLSELGVECAVIAPTLAPVKAGDRVKTDRRDAERLALASGKLTQQNAQILDHDLKTLGVHPAPHLLVNHLPRWQVVRHHAPLITGLYNVTQPVEYSPQRMFALCCILTAQRQIRRNERPLLIADIARIPAPILPQHANMLPEENQPS